MIFIGTYRIICGRGSVFGAVLMNDVGVGFFVLEVG